MDQNEIPEGVRTVVQLSGESAEKIWNGLKNALDTADKLTVFNETIAKVVAKRKAGQTDFEVAMAAMHTAGEAIFGSHRPRIVSDSESLVRLSGGILRRVRD